MESRLLNPRAIRYLTENVHDLAKRRGLGFVTQIVTNTVLLTPEMANFLALHNWDRLQTTFDGPKETHDQIRVGHKGQPTFDKIIENLSYVIDNRLLPIVDIRVNFDRSNVDIAPRLLDFFVQKGWVDRINLSFGKITQTLETHTNSAVSYIDLNALTEVEAAEKYVWLWSQAQERGFEIPDELTVGPWCIATSKHAVLIEPDGSLSKCLSLVGRREFFFDHITNNSPSTINPNFDKFGHIAEALDKNCPYIPICGGGCRFDALVERKGFEGISCNCKEMDIINKGLLQLKYS